MTWRAAQWHLDVTVGAERRLAERGGAAGSLVLGAVRGRLDVTVGAERRRTRTGHAAETWRRGAL
jgi:hypothetical protein